MLDEQLLRLPPGDEQERLGNLVVYTADLPGQDNSFLLSTMLLLYLVDVESIARTGARISPLEYHAWQRGPVAPRLHLFTQHMPYSHYLYNFVMFWRPKFYPGYQTQILISKVPFDTDPFKPGELRILEEVVARYRHLPFHALQALAKRAGGHWSRTVERHGLFGQFRRGVTSTTVPIEFQ